MKKAIKYTIFKTKWGDFGLAGTEYGLLRTHLPAACADRVKAKLLADFDAPRYDRRFFSPIQEQIKAYFEGDCVDFRDVPVVLACAECGRADGFSKFTISVLTACRDIGFGRTTNYAQLAKMLGRAAAGRAAGAALGKNPLPLIIPCHRIICSNGGIGGFSATGEKNLKEKLLKHERRVAAISNPT